MDIKGPELVLQLGFSGVLVREGIGIRALQDTDTGACRLKSYMVRGLFGSSILFLV